MVKVTATNGTFGVSRPIGGCNDLAVARAAVGQTDLLDHEGLHDRMAKKNVPRALKCTWAAAPKAA